MPLRPPLLVLGLLALGACGRGDVAVDDDTDPAVDSDTPACAVVPASAPMHRISQLAFDRALRDVLGVDDAPGKALPRDPVASGFNTTSSAQAVGGAWLAGAFRITGDVAERVMAPRGWSVAFEAEDLHLVGDAFEVASNEPGTWLLLAQPQTARLLVDVPEAGTYRVRLRAAGVVLWPDIGDPPLGQWPDVAITVDGTSVGALSIDRESYDDADYAVDVQLDPGVHAVNLALTPHVPYYLQLDRIDVTRLAVTLAERATPQRDRLLTCDPYVDDPGPCVDAILAPVARRLWRRPLTDDELAGLRALVTDAEDIDDGLTAALHRLIASPYFLFLPELPGDRALTPWEVGARLADVVWASVPDDTLLDCASQGGLAADDEGPCGLTAQLDRMLADPRSDGIVLEFADGWLGTADLSATLDPASYPTVDAALVASMGEEVHHVFADALLRDAPLSELVASEQTFVDSTLAAFYGLPDPGPGWQRVSGASTRGGVLRQAAWLASTGEAARTSPVRRGVWVLAQLLCEPPEEPPMVMSLEGDVTDPREALERHVNDPACTGCHKSIDPIGFALETFDQVGQVRSGSVDATGTMPDGTTVDGPADLAAWVVSHEGYARCVATQLSTWALRRATGPADACLLDTLGADAGTGVTTTLRTLLSSPAFLQHREAQP